MIVLDHKRRLSFVLHRKVASSSLATAITWTEEGTKLQAMEAAYPILSWIRPWEDRLVSAMYSVHSGMWANGEDINDCVEKVKSDEHVFSQGYDLFRLKMGFLGLYENLPQDWERLRELYDYPALPHKNRGLARPRDWRETDIDFDRFRPYYTRDERLCRDSISTVGALDSLESIRQANLLLQPV